MKIGHNNDTACQQPSLPDGELRKALVLADSPERIDATRRKAHIPDNEFVGFTDSDKAIEAWETGVFDFVLIDGAKRDAGTMDLIRKFHSEGIDELGILQHCQSLPNFPTNIWEQALTGFFHHVRNEEDRFAAPISYLLNTPSELKWVSMTLSEINRVLRKMADHAGNTLLIRGAKGSGKYPIALFIHQQSEMRNRPFSFVHCGNTEHFERIWTKKEEQAYANNLRHIFDNANNGTVYFHNVELLSYEEQTILADVLTVILKPKACNSKDKFQFKGNVIFATASDLEKEVADRHFCHRLYDIIKLPALRVPRLCDFKDEILPLAKEFLLYHCRQGHRAAMDFSEKGAKKIIESDWRDNLRLLDAIMRYCAVHTEQNIIDEEDIMIQRLINVPDTDHDISKRIKTALRKNKGNQSASAREINMERSKFDREMKRLGIVNHYKRRNVKSEKNTDDSEE